MQGGKTSIAKGWCCVLTIHLLGGIVKLDNRHTRRGHLHIGKVLIFPLGSRDERSRRSGGRFPSRLLCCGRKGMMMRGYKSRCCSRETCGETAVAGDGPLMSECFSNGAAQHVSSEEMSFEVEYGDGDQ